MHKRTFLFLILIIFMLLLTGCSRINHDDNYENHINNIIKNKNKYTNSTSIGYKYYLPKGATLIKNNDFNVVFSSNNVNIYLYVDAVSYYYKKELNLNDGTNYDYFKKIENYGKKGYVAIKYEGDKYYVKIVYNYSKIEFYTLNNLPRLIDISTIILNSIDYKDNMIERILKNTSASTAEISYQVGELKQGESSFSQYLNEYISEDEKIELPESE